MVGFKLVTCLIDGEPKAGLLVNGTIHDIAAVTGNPHYRTVLGILEAWEEAEPALADLAGSLAARPGLALDDAELMAPIPLPPAIFCAGGNYADHNRAMANRVGIPVPDMRANGGYPYHFMKASRCCVGPDAEVVMPSKVLDWEGELVAVIGKTVKDVPVSEALGAVAGYMVGNDLSARDVAFRHSIPRDSVFHQNWLDHKNFDASAPMGPWLTPASDVPDPMNLRLVTKVNGDTKQDASTGLMIFSVAELIAQLSERCTLYPGDVIMTGSPEGVGMETGQSLFPGDVVTVEIDGLGQISTMVQANPKYPVARS